MKSLQKIFCNTPLIIFLLMAVVITEFSLIFPQNIGRFQKAAGWPLTMYRIHYKTVGDFTSSGELIHRLEQVGADMSWKVVFLNIILWSLMFYGSWVLYERKSKVRLHKKNAK